MSGAGKNACGKTIIRTMLIGVVACGGTTIRRESSAKEIIWDQRAQFESKIGDITRETSHEQKSKVITAEVKEERRGITSMDE